MQGARHDSDSQVQRDAEALIFDCIQERLGVALASNPTIPLPETECRIRPDFYSANPPIIGEIFAHQGVPKAGQSHKLAGDILKMLLLERLAGQSFRKIVAICDPDLERYLTGDSWLAECIRQFDVELICVELDSETVHRLRAAQHKQRMVNPHSE